MTDMHWLRYEADNFLANAHYEELMSRLDNKRVRVPTDADRVREQKEFDFEREYLDVLAKLAHESRILSRRTSV